MERNVDMLNVIIDDENGYFAVGLKLSIEKYAYANNKTVRFLPAGCGERADIVLVSVARRARYWGRQGRGDMNTHTVTIKERRTLPASGMSLVLFRTDDRKRLFELLTEVLTTYSVCGFTRRVLTLRERQVAGYLRRGLDQSQTARVLGLSVKTVHSHKRSIMGKLMLKRNHDFMYWLLSQEGDYS